MLISKDIFGWEIMKWKGGQGKLPSRPFSYWGVINKERRIMKDF